MTNTRLKATEFRHQTTTDTEMIAVYNAISKSEIVRAIRSFWLPFAAHQQGEFDPDDIQAIALDSAEALEAQALLIRQRFGLEMPEFDSQLLDEEDEEEEHGNVRRTLLFDDDDELD